jgi:hypothetical protein
MVETAADRPIRKVRNRGRFRQWIVLEGGKALAVSAGEPGGKSRGGRTAGRASDCWTAGRVIRLFGRQNQAHQGVRATDHFIKLVLTRLVRQANSADLAFGVKLFYETRSI